MLPSVGCIAADLRFGPGVGQLQAVPLSAIRCQYIVAADVKGFMSMITPTGPIRTWKLPRLSVP